MNVSMLRDAQMHAGKQSYVPAQDRGPEGPQQGSEGLPQDPPGQPRRWGWDSLKVQRRKGGPGPTEVDPLLPVVSCRLKGTVQIF